MSVPNKINDYLEDALSVTPEQFHEKPNYEAFLKTWMDSFQEVEDVFYDGLFKGRQFFNAEGDALTKIAHLLGLQREIGESDASLRARIAGVVTDRASDASPDRVREIFSALTGVKNIRIFEHYPCSVMMYGYIPDENFDFVGTESSYIKKAMPVSTGSVIVGYVRGEDSSRLFIPSEIGYELKNKVAYAPDPTVTPPDSGTTIELEFTADTLYEWDVTVDLGANETEFNSASLELFYNGVKLNKGEDAIWISPNKVGVRYLSVSNEDYLAIRTQVSGTGPQPPFYLWNIVTPDGSGGLNNIVVRDVGSSFFQGNLENAILPEIGVRYENFEIENPVGEREEFLVNNGSGSELFRVNIEGVDNSKGIMLEIDQVVIPNTTD